MIWLIGHKGMLGTELGRQLTEHKIAWVGSGHEVDITKTEDLSVFASSHDRAANRTGSAVAKGTVSEKISWVINCAAYTNVEKAEDEDEAPKVKLINEDGTRNIARVARTIGARLIHISTDYVFDGEAREPYTEDAQKNPLGVYALTKANAENAIQKEMTQYYILRTAWLYGFEGDNFVYTMTRAMNANEQVQVVDDQKGTPTFAGDLAALIIKIIQTAENAPKLFGKNSAIPYGIYNYTNAGETTWFDFAQKIYEFGHKYKRITQACAVHSCTSQEFVQKAKRPAYSVLNTEKIQKALKIKIPHWQESLERFIKSNKFQSN